MLANYHVEIFGKVRRPRLWKEQEQASGDVERQLLFLIRHPGATNAMTVTSERIHQANYHATILYFSSDLEFAGKSEGAAVGCQEGLLSFGSYPRRKSGPVAVI